MLRRALFNNFKFVYRIDQWMRKRFTLTGMLVIGGIIFSSIFGIDTRQTLAFQVFSLLFCLLLIAILSNLLFSLLSKDRFSIRRKLPEYCTVGQPVSYRVIIKNLTGQLQQSLSLMDELVSPMPDYNEFKSSAKLDKDRNWFDRFVGYPRWLQLVHNKRGASIPVTTINTIPPNQEITVNVTLTPAHRGYINFKQSTLFRPDPVGLSNACISFVKQAPLLVLPKRYTIPPLPLAGKRKYQQHGVNLASSVGESQEFMSLRDYRPGDALRNIHWRSFAKLSKPIVKEYQEEFFVRMGLVLDTFATDITEDIFEEAVSIAASLVNTSQSNDSLLDLMFVGTDTHCFTSGRNLSNTRHMLEILACVTICHDKPFSVLSSLVTGHAHRLSGLICVFLNWDASRQELIKKLKSLQVPVLVFVITESSVKENYEPGPMKDTPELFRILHQGKIEEELTNLNIN